MRLLLLFNDDKFERLDREILYIFSTKYLVKNCTLISFENINGTNLISFRCNVHPFKGKGKISVK